jgi:hypothetical protein
MGRFINKETKAISRGQKFPRKEPRGLIIKSAEGVRFAYTTTSLPAGIGEIAVPKSVIDAETLTPESPEVVE